MAEAVARIARHGVDQYLDVGAGLPTRPSTHATAQALLPAARVVYIDRDPVVVTHATDLVPAGVRYQDGDLNEPEALLAALGYRPASATRSRAGPPAPAAAIDFSRPVCLVLALIVQALEPGTARSVVAVLVKALAPGSYLVATAGAGDAGRLPDSVWPSGATEADLAAFFGGLDLLPPGSHPARRRAVRRRREAVPGRGLVDEIADGVFVAHRRPVHDDDHGRGRRRRRLPAHRPGGDGRRPGRARGLAGGARAAPGRGLVHPPALGSPALVARVRPGAEVRDAARGRGRRPGAARARHRGGGRSPRPRPDVVRPGRAAARPRDRLGRAARGRLPARRARARARRGAAAGRGRADRGGHALRPRDPAARPGVGRPVRRLPAGTRAARERAGRARAGARPRSRRRPGRVPPPGRRRPRLPGRDRGRRGPGRRTPHRRTLDRRLAPRRARPAPRTRPHRRR